MCLYSAQDSDPFHEHPISNLVLMAYQNSRIAIGKIGKIGKNSVKLQLK